MVVRIPEVLWLKLKMTLSCGCQMYLVQMEIILTTFYMFIGISVERINFMIYDRWGSKVFQTTNPNQGWDGTYNGKLLPPDVFVYYIDATFNDGQKKAIKGSVAILK